MAYEIPGFSFTLIAAADLRLKQFCAVNIDATGKINLPAAGGRVAGWLQNKPNTGDGGTLVTTGVTKAYVGVGGVTAGDNVKALADGRVTTAGAATYAVGIALATGLVGEVVPVLITPSGGGGLIA